MNAIGAPTFPQPRDQDPASLRGLGPEQTCGAYPLRGLLTAARRRGLSVELLDLRSSGDTAGPRDRVVGYGAVPIA